MESFRVNINSHIRSGGLIILGILICFNFPRILLFLYPNQRNEDSNWMGIIVFVLFAVPAIIIHINYYLVNRCDVLEYSFRQKEIRITRRGISTTFSLDDIEHIERSVSFNYAANRSSMLPWDSYNHSIIHLKNGDVFTVTSLLVPDFDLPVEKEKVTIKRNMYRLARII